MNRIRTKAGALLLAACLAVGAIGIGGIDIGDDWPFADEAAEAHRNTCLEHTKCGFFAVSHFITHRYWQPKFHQYNVITTSLFSDRITRHTDYVYDPN